MKFRYTLFPLILLITACVGNLDTANKRFAAFEISYKNALVEIDGLERTNRLKPETKAKLAPLLEDVNKARKAAYLAKDSGDILKAQDMLSLAIAALDKLKTALPQDAQL